jgi:hypothetical protein
MQIPPRETVRQETKVNDCYGNVNSSIYLNGKGETVKYIVLLVALSLLAACVTVKPTTAPDGRRAYAISCGGPHTLGDCYDKAAEVCHGAYNVIGGESGSRGFVSGNMYGMYGGSVPQRTMIIECR